MIQSFLQKKEVDITPHYPHIAKLFKFSLYINQEEENEHWEEDEDEEESKDDLSSSDNLDFD